MIAPIEAISQAGNEELVGGQLPYGQFEAAETVPAFGTSAATTTTASMASPSDTGTMRRRALSDMR